MEQDSLDLGHLAGKFEFKIENMPKAESIYRKSKSIEDSKYDVSDNHNACYNIILCFNKLIIKFMWKIVFFHF